MIKIGIIGCGYWGPNLVRNFYELPDTELTYVCDLDSNKLKKIKNRYPKTAAVTDYKQILSDKSIDAVVIATPVSTHYKLAKESLISSKDVMVEKPLTTDSKTGMDLVNLARKKKKILMVGHTFLYSPPVNKVKEIIKQGTLGKIYYIDSSRVNLGLFQPDVSVLWDLGPHDLSILLYWLESKPIKVSAYGKSFVQKSIEEVAYIRLEFDNGTIANIHVSWLAPHKLRRTALVGSEKMLVYDDNENIEKIKIFNKGVVKNPETFGEFQLSYRFGDITSPHIDASEPLKLETQDFIKSVKDRTEPRSSGFFGAQVVKVLEHAHQSLKNNGIPTKMN